MLAVSNHYLNNTLHHLSQVEPVSYRRIFAGAGIYHDAQLFALVASNKLYFRVDENSVTPYLNRAMPALKPSSALICESHFYQLPDEVLEDSAELLYWMRAAVEASQPMDWADSPGASSVASAAPPAYRRFLAG